MGSRITPATLTVTVTEAITLNSVDLGCANTLSIASIGEIDQRILSVPTASEIVIANLGTADSAGTYKRSGLKYIRITNMDDTNFIRLRIKDTDNNEQADFRVLKGQSFILSDSVISTAAGAFAAWEDIETISAQADTADVDIQLYVALA